MPLEMSKKIESDRNWRSGQEGPLHRSTKAWVREEKSRRLKPDERAADPASGAATDKIRGQIAGALMNASARALFVATTEPDWPVEIA